MLHLKNLSDKYQKRTLRVEYGQTQATPYDLELDPSFRNTDGSFRLPLSTDTATVVPSGGAAAAPFTRSANAFSLKNGLVPGTVMILTSGEYAAVATGADAATHPFGLLANFVGGNIDDVGDENKISAWRGSDSTYSLLAPAFLDAGVGGTSMSSAYTTAVNSGSSVLLYACTDGRLSNFATPSARTPVARLIQRVSASRIVIDLKI